MPGFVVGDPINKPKNVPLLPHIQGIRSSLDDIVLRGAKFTDQIGDVLLNGTLVRKISGASELKLEIEDKDAKLLNSKLLESDYHLMLDGLGFSYVSYERSGILQPLVLNHEAQIVHRLRKLHGPHKAFRDEVTRAEFAKARVMELKEPRPRFICPELHKAQPIKTEREARQRTQESKEERGPGISTEANLTIEGQPASTSQKELGHMAMQIAEGVNAPFRVCVALIAALMDESSMGRAAPGNVLEALGPGGAPVGSAAEEITGFLTGKNWTIPGGAIGYFKAHPQAKAYEIAQEVQRSGAGESSKGAANYGRFTAEAVKWVEAYGGAEGSTGQLQPQRFPFEEKEKEDHWKCITGLAAAVNWRCFESAGWIYFIAEPTLLESHRRMTISDSTPGILDTSIKGHSGKSHDEITVEAMVKEWAAPPGSAVMLKRHGPADGIYLVDRIQSPLALRESVATIQLKRPTKPKKEPAPQTKTKSVTFGGGKAGTTQKIEEAFNVEGVEAWENGIIVAKWIIPALEWAKANGGNTEITSGYRPGVDPHTASGTSEHQGTKYPHGAIDFGGFVDATGKAHRESFLHSLEKTGYPGPMLKRPEGFSDDGHCSGTGH